MERSVYDSQEWRRLPRELCVVALLFGGRAGPCHGRIDRHHVDPPHDRSIQVCARHHPKLETALRHLEESPRPWKRCPHQHRSRESREACERRLNADLVPTAA